MSRGYRMIPFHKPYKLEKSLPYIQEAISIGKLQGDGKYTSLCTSWLQEKLQVNFVKMMNSCTSALECAIQAIGLESGDEVIIPSFTYPSTANAIILAGGTVVYSEVDKETLTLDPKLIESKITPKTKGIIVVHYGGVCCQMNEIMTISKKYDLTVIEDAAQGFLAKYKDNYAGTIADMGCFSFHGTKDVIAGEGGAILVNNPKYLQAVEVFRQKGTNVEGYKKGICDYYEWVDKGSSQSPDELSMAMLYGQLQIAEEIVNMRLERYNIYAKHFGRSEKFAVNGHLFYLLFDTITRASEFKKYVEEEKIEVRTHFVPLHESKMGSQFIRDNNNFIVEEQIGKRLVRLPLYPNLKIDELKYILKVIDDFFERNL